MRSGAKNAETYPNLPYFPEESKEQGQVFRLNAHGRFVCVVCEPSAQVFTERQKKSKHKNVYRPLRKG